METNLRLILLGIGVIIIALIYFWGMRKRIKASFAERRRRKAAARAPENQPVFQGADSDQAIIGSEEAAFIGESARAIGDNASAAIDSATDRPDPALSTDAAVAEAQAVAAEPSALPEAMADSLANPPAAETEPLISTAEAEPIPAPTQATVGSAPAQKTVLLSVLGQGGKPLQGPAIAAASRDLALTLNEKGTLDCTTDAGKGGKTIFSVGHLKEPGVFDPNTIKSLSTPGLLLYMQLPGPLDAVAAVDLMMATAGQLAKHLGGSVCDEKRNKMTTQAMIHLRSEAAEFERRLAAQ